MEATTELTREVRAKRVAVMADVIKQLDRMDTPLKVARGIYLAGQGDIAEIGPGGLQPHVDYVQKYCKACMLGSMFLSFARVFNGVPSDVVGGGQNFIAVDDSDLRSSLRDAFGACDLDEIESAFEQKNMNRADDFDDEDDGTRDVRCQLAAKFGKQFDSPRDAARAIAQNIVNHDGEFVLPATPA